MFIADSAVSQQQLGIAQYEKMFSAINAMTFLHYIYRLKCILQAAPGNAERSGKISEHLCSPIGKAYKPMQKVLQNSQLSRKSFVSTTNHEKTPLEPLHLRARAGRGQKKHKLITDFTNGTPLVADFLLFCPLLFASQSH